MTHTHANSLSHTDTQAFYDATVTDDSLQSEWADQLRFAATPGGWLESGHIFALANALRRPILVHGSFAIDEAANVTGVNFMRGIYLPLLHAPAECCRDPLAIWCVSLVTIPAELVEPGLFSIFIGCPAFFLVYSSCVVQNSCFSRCLVSPSL